MSCPSASLMLASPKLQIGWDDEPLTSNVAVGAVSLIPIFPDSSIPILVEAPVPM